LALTNALILDSSDEVAVVVVDSEEEEDEVATTDSPEGADADDDVVAEADSSLLTTCPSPLVDVDGCDACDGVEDDVSVCCGCCTCCASVLLSLIFFFFFSSSFLQVCLVLFLHLSYLYRPNCLRYMIVYKFFFYGETIFNRKIWSLWSFFSLFSESPEDDEFLCFDNSAQIGGISS